MTEQLKDLLDSRAESIDFAQPDLHTITTVGDGRIRRRRVARLGAGVATLAVVGTVAGLGISQLGGSSADDRAADGAPLTTLAGQLTWADGGVLHTPGAQVDVGHTISIYVQTQDGIVYTDPDGTVWSWAGDGSTRVGQISKDVHLVADADGTRAGWVDSSQSRTEFAVVDQATGRVSHAAYVDSSGPDAKAAVYAIDGGTAYVQDDRGVVALDLTDGTAKVVAPAGTEVLDVESGVIAFGADDHHTTRIGTTLADAREIPQSYSGVGQLSPGARWFNGDADAPEVFDAATLQPLPVDVPDGYFADGYQWLNDDTLAVLVATTKDATPRIYTCHLPEGTCTVAVTGFGYDFGAKDSSVLPYGASVSD